MRNVMPFERNEYTMKVKEVIAKLLEYNQEADFEIITDGSNLEFSFVHGTAEGCTKVNCSKVGLYLNETCQNEQA